MIDWSETQDDNDAHVLCATLARPEKRNALTPAMLTDLANCAGRVESADRVGALVLKGAGEVFSAGFDLSLCRENPDAMRELLRLLADATQALRTLPVPTVCCVQGAALAGGCALAAATDFIVSHSDARFGYPVTRLGVSPAVSGPVLLPAIGIGRARERLLDPGAIRGDEAQRMGLLWRCVADPNDLERVAMDKAFSLARKPTHALAATKQWLNELDGSTAGDLTTSGRAASDATAASDEYATRIEEFWKGK